MSDTVKLIIEIDNVTYSDIKKGKIYSSFRDVPLESVEAIANGTPLANDSERAEVQAYFAGQTYGWEQGRKALIEELKAEIDEKISHYDHFSSSNTANGLSMAKEIVEKYREREE